MYIILGRINISVNIINNFFLKYQFHNSFVIFIHYLVAYKIQNRFVFQTFFYRTANNLNIFMRSDRTNPVYLIPIFVLNKNNWKKIEYNV